MMLSGFDIRKYIEEKRLIIEPLKEDTVRENGVDLHVGNQVARLKQTDETLDLRHPHGLDNFYDVENGDVFTIKPSEKFLLCTLEHIELPVDLAGLVELRSTFARYGFILPPTVIDGGFRGNITLGMMGTPFQVRLYSGDRFAHIVFVKLISPVEKPYSGKYQNQQGITLPRLDSNRETN